MMKLSTKADSKLSAGTEAGICNLLMLQCEAQLASNPMLPAVVRRHMLPESGQFVQCVLGCNVGLYKVVSPVAITLAMSCHVSYELGRLS